MGKYEEIKNEYRELISCVKELYPDVSADSVFVYYASAVLKIWGSNLLYSTEYTGLLSAISGERFTLEQVVTAMSCCGDPERKIMIPQFYKDIVSTGDEEKVSLVIDKINSIFVASAMINGDFTTEESVCLTEIISDLINYAQRTGIKANIDYDYSSIITEKNESSYLQNEALISAACEEKARSTENSAKQNSAPKESPVNIYVNLAPDTSNKTVFKDDEVTDDSLSVSDTVAPMLTTIESEENETMESLLAELDSLVGLSNVKKDVHSLMNFIKVTKLREQRGMKVPTISYHLVFTGNPGTGKTTVARLVAKLYYHMGILSKGQLVESDRSALVAGYLGQTAIKTQKVIQQAMGGVLFVDEAYALVNEKEDSYGKEAIETLLKAMEDHRDEFVVIVAGYTELMHKFIESNPGLSSRFGKYFEFEDYTGEELLAIFKRFCKSNGYSLDLSSEELLKNKFYELYEKRDMHFGNARTARNIFEKAINAQADRISALTDISDSDLELIQSADIIAAIGGAVK